LRTILIKDIRKSIRDKLSRPASEDIRRGRGSKEGSVSVGYAWVGPPPPPREREEKAAPVLRIASSGL
jgi:hypothetical protein